MRVTHQINVIIDDGTDGEDLLFGLNATNAKMVVDGMQRFTSGRFEIDADDEETISFGDVQDVRFVYVKADNDFDFRVNGSDEAISVKRGTELTGSTARFAGELDITGLVIVNPSADAVLRGIYCLYGDPV